MFAKRVIPCLDVNRGRVVKGTNFLNLRDAGDPVGVAERYEEEGADELVFLDITASHEGRDIILDVVRRTAEVIFMPLTVGGGIRTVDDIRALLNAGCDKVSINSPLIPICPSGRRASALCIVVNIDRNESSTTAGVLEVHINGGRIGTGLETAAWARGGTVGAGEIVLTRWTDGTKAATIWRSPGGDRGLDPGGCALDRAPRRRNPDRPTPRWPPALITGNTPSKKRNESCNRGIPVRMTKCQ